MNFTFNQKYVVNQIEIGSYKKYLGSIVSYPKKREQLSKDIIKLKSLGIIFEMSGELCVNSSSKYYRLLQ